jgi:hypothetical protein
LWTLEQVFGETGNVSKDAPYAPPIVQLDDTGAVAHLLAWELVEADGQWWAWVSWVNDASARPKHLVVQVRADQLQPLEQPAAYARVERRVRGLDGVIRQYRAE